MKAKVKPPLNERRFYFIITLKHQTRGYAIHLLPVSSSSVKKEPLLYRSFARKDFTAISILSPFSVSAAIMSAKAHANTPTARCGFF